MIKLARPIPQHAQAASSTIAMTHEPLGVVLLKLHGKADVAQVETLLGLTLPQRGASTGNASPRWHWLAPHEWLALGEEKAVMAIADQCHALVDLAGTVIDLTHGRQSLLCRGAAIETVLAAFIPIDLSRGGFAVGAATQCLFADVPIFIERLGPDHFRLIVDQTMADYVADLIAETAQ